MIKWLTKEYIKEQAKLGILPALKCTKKHWQQIKKGIEIGEFEEAHYKGLVGIYISSCAVCINQGECSSCPLWENGNCCNGLCGIFTDARTAKNAQAIVDYIDEKIKELKKK